MDLIKRMALVVFEYVFRYPVSNPCAKSVEMEDELSAELPTKLKPDIETIYEEMDVVAAV